MERGSTLRRACRDRAPHGGAAASALAFRPLNGHRALLSDPERLAALRRTGLLDTAPETAFDRLTALAARLSAAPVGLVSLVDEHRLFFKSATGLPEPWSTLRQAPLSHTFCQYALLGGPFGVEDARDVPFLRDSPAIADLHMVAYLGVPLTSREGLPIGTLCVAGSEPRTWSPGDIDIVRRHAGAATSLIKRRTESGSRAAAAERRTMPRADSGRGRRGEQARRPRVAGGSEPSLRVALRSAAARAVAGIDSALGSH